MTIQDIRLFGDPVLRLGEEEQSWPEGCLSIPGVTLETRRALTVLASGQDEHGEPVTVEGTSMLARAVQHETDHLDGVLFIDRLDPDQRREAMRLIREADWVGERRPVVKASPHAAFGGRG